MRQSAYGITTLAKTDCYISIVNESCTQVRKFVDELCVHQSLFIISP